MPLDDEIRGFIDLRLARCKEEVEDRLNLMHTDMSQIRGEIHGMRVEFTAFTSRVTESTDQMSKSLDSIADNMGRLADLPEAWTKLKGFIAVLGWIKDNWLVFAMLGGIVIGSLWLLGFKVNIG